MKTCNFIKKDTIADIFSGNSKNINTWGRVTHKVITNFLLYKK